MLSPTAKTSYKIHDAWILELKNHYDPYAQMLSLMPALLLTRLVLMILFLALLLYSPTFKTLYFQVSVNKVVTQFIHDARCYHSTFLHNTEVTRHFFGK